MRTVDRIVGLAAVLLAAVATLLTGIPAGYPLPLIPPDPGTTYSARYAAGHVANHGTATWEIAVVVFGTVIVTAVIAGALIRIRTHLLAHNATRETKAGPRAARSKAHDSGRGTSNPSCA